MDLHKIASRISDELDLEDEEWDPMAGIIDGAEELNIKLTETDVRKALQDTGLDAEDISLNQPVIPTGKPLPPGIYTFYKGGEITPGGFLGFVTDDPEYAKNWGEVHEVTVECTGETTSKWNYVHDWDGNPQLVMPGAVCSKFNEDSWLILKSAV
jgi:hypothetical protein